MALTDVSGNVVQSYQYDPYGNVTSTTGSITANPWQFAGGFYDNTTGLYKFGVRYYDPTLGRWTQQDPLGGSLFDPSTGNRYIYANDDPTNLTDPTGTDGSCQWAKLGLWVGFVASSVLFVTGFALIATAALAAPPTLAGLPLALSLVGDLATAAVQFASFLFLKASPC